MNRVNLLTSTISMITSLDHETNMFNIEYSENFTEEDFEYIKLLLIMNRQMELYLRQLLGQLSIIDSEVGSDIMRYKRILEELHHSVQYKAAVPTELVFVSEKFRLDLGE